MPIYQLDERDCLFSARSRALNPRKLKRWEKERAQKRRVKIDALSVEEKFSQGYYDRHEYKALYHGIKVWNRKCNIINAIGGHEIAFRPTLALGFPVRDVAPVLGAQVWEKSQVFYWSFAQSGNMPLYCVFDLLDRLLDSKYWQSDFLEIPIFWSLGNEKCKTLAAQKIPEINRGRWAKKRPYLPPSADDYDEWRHRCTPYDYEWQTHKYSRDAAYSYWQDKWIELTGSMS